MDNIQNKKDKFEKIKKATGSVLKFSCTKEKKEKEIKQIKINGKTDVKF